MWWAQMNTFHIGSLPTYALPFRRWDRKQTWSCVWRREKQFIMSGQTFSDGRPRLAHPPITLTWKVCLNGEHIPHRFAIDTKRTKCFLSCNCKHDGDMCWTKVKSFFVLPCSERAFNSFSVLFPLQITNNSCLSVMHVDLKSLAIYGEGWLAWEKIGMFKLRSLNHLTHIRGFQLISWKNHLRLWL